MAKKKVTDAMKREIESNVGALEQEIVKEHCTNILEETKAEMEKLAGHVQAAVDKFKEFARRHDFNITHENVTSTDTSISIGFTFSVDEEKIYRREKHVALKAFLDSQETN